jgi:hypothetical protein
LTPESSSSPAHLAIGCHQKKPSARFRCEKSTWKIKKNNLYIHVSQNWNASKNAGREPKQIKHQQYVPHQIEFFSLFPHCP